MPAHSPARATQPPAPAVSDGRTELSDQDGLGNGAMMSMLDCEREVVPGDTLWGLAEESRGDGSAWLDIFENNRDIIGEDPNLIHPGQVLDVCDGTETEVEVAQAVAEAGPTLDITEGGMSTDITEPTTITSSIGDMQVYPDSFVGPLPPGAVYASDHARMVSTFESVRDGTGSLTIDTSSMTDGVSILDPIAYVQAHIEAAQFEATQLEYLRQLVRTGVGLEMMEELATNEHTTTIGRASGNSNTTGYADNTARGDGTGTDVTIGMNPNLSSYAGPGETEEAWMTERQQYGLYHEMVHAYHGVQGNRASGQSPGVDVHDGSVRNLNNAEWQAMGMGAYSGNTISDNAIREAMGKETRPHYGDLTPQP